MEPASRVSVFRHDRLLGTVVDVRVASEDTAQHPAIDRVIVDEIVRLESVFSAYDEHSELNRWKRDELPEPSSDLVEVMSAALRWQHRSSGTFNPMSGVLSDLWRRAADDDVLPSPGELRDAAQAISAPRFEVQGGVVHRLGDCSMLNLNAVAKGYIVDRACELAVDRFDASMVLVSAGGDLAHRGESPARVGIENPLRPYDNEPPLTEIQLRNAGMATSGRARRGVRIGGERFSHVIDPRSGEPVSTQASISVVAATAVDADVLATVLGMDRPAEAVDAAHQYDNIACLVVGSDGSQHTDARWLDRFGAPSR